MIRANSTSAVAFGTWPQGHDGLVLPNNLGCSRRQSDGIDATAIAFRRPHRVFFDPGDQPPQRSLPAPSRQSQADRRQPIIRATHPDPFERAWSTAGWRLLGSARFPRSGRPSRRLRPTTGMARVGPKATYALHGLVLRYPLLGKPMTEKRRLAAIMAIDVVGYSRLMGEDEVGTARAVREYPDTSGPVNN